MRLKYTFETVNMGDEFIMVPIGNGANQVRGVIKVNQSGSTIVDMLRNDVSEKEIVDSLSEKYENKEELKEYVHKVIEILQKNGLLE